MSMLLAHFTELLDTYGKGETDQQLWAASIETLAKTFEADEGGDESIFRCNLQLTSIFKHSGETIDYAQS